MKLLPLAALFVAALSTGGPRLPRAKVAHPADSSLYIMQPVPGGRDSLGRSFILMDGDTLHTSFMPQSTSTWHLGKLTDADYSEAGRRMGVESAAIRAVVDIETGKTRSGFFLPGKPVINFDLPLFRRALKKRGIKASNYPNSEALKPLNIKKYGSQQGAQQARLRAAMAIDSVAAMESTFWGMFQIGGFNWKLCGAPSRRDFIRLMSRSEADQLRLFTDFIENTGMAKHLKTKNWAAFARQYNGPSYAARGYHTRMASAYRNHKSQGK